MTDAKRDQPLKRDVARARRAIVELGKALDSAGFQPPEAPLWLERASDAISEIERAVFGSDLYDLVGAAFNVPHEEAKRRIIAIAYGGKLR